LAHKTQYPFGLIGPSTSLHVFEAAMELVQMPHFWSPLGLSWYFTPAFACFFVAVAAVAGELNSELVQADCNPPSARRATPPCATEFRLLVCSLY
jgi:hypothetical protein